jgi:hypothetical protein
VKKVYFNACSYFKFEYDPEKGFLGMLNTDVREFECRGFFDDIVDFQRYDLERKTYNTKIAILPPPTLDLVPIENEDLFTIDAAKDQTLNLTCLADVGCNDINYDIKFRTNTSDTYKIILNPPDRRKCLLNFNEMSSFSKSIIIDKLTHNVSYFQCEFSYSSELKTVSSNYIVYFPGSAYLFANVQNATEADYTLVTDDSSLLTININFASSSAFDLVWFLNSQKLDTDSSKEDAKFQSECIHVGVFTYKCFLNIDSYSTKDVGLYEALITLKDDPTIKLRLNITVIKPSKTIKRLKLG